MKSLFAGLLAAGAFSASFAASVETQVEQNVVAPIRQVIVEPVNRNVVQPINQNVVKPVNENVVQPTYDIFGKAIVVPLAETVKQIADGEADRIICVSQPDNDCTPCKLQHPIIDKLKKEGYDAKVVLVKDYNGKEPVNRTPTLLYFNGDKLVKKNVGLQSYEAITKILKKPALTK